MENKQNEKTQEVVKDTTPTEQTETVKTEDAGTEREPNLIEQAKAENDRKAELLKEELALQERKEKLHAEQMVGGRSGMSATEKPKVLTDTEYAEALERGEVDPLKADGFSH